MKFKIVVLAAVTGLLVDRPVSAEWAPTPIIAYCKVPYMNSTPIYAHGAYFFKSPKEGSSDTMSYRQNLKVREDYVQPAMNKGCANKPVDGLDWLTSVKNACEQGCATVNGQFGGLVSEPERETLSLTCLNACDIGTSTMLGYGIGFAMGAVYKK